MKLNLFYAALLSPALLYLSACGNDASDSSGANRTPHKPKMAMTTTKTVVMRSMKAMMMPMAAIMSS